MPGSAEYIEQIAAGKSGTFTDAERTEALEHYHTEYGCIECGGRTLGCTSTHCAVDHALREMDAVEFHRFAERTRYLNRAVTFEAIRRVFGAEIR